MWFVRAYCTNFPFDIIADETGHICLKIKLWAMIENVYIQTETNNVHFEFYLIGKGGYRSIKVYLYDT